LLLSLVSARARINPAIAAAISALAMIAQVRVITTTGGRGVAAITSSVVALASI
jgi:hypothetical protein